MRALAETPEAEPRQASAVDAAKDLVALLNRLSDAAATTRQNADASIDAEVATVNTNLQKIADLNAKIQFIAPTDLTLPTLIDERERLVDEISAIIPVKGQLQDSGALHLYTAEGVFILRERAETVSFNHNAIITAQMEYQPAGAGALSGIFVGTQEITPGSGDRFAVHSGSLAGHFTMRDDLAIDFQDRIDGFAADLVARFEDPTVDPTLTAGDPGLFTDGGAPLDPLLVTGLAGRISLNALADPLQGGTVSALRDGLQAAAPGPAASDTIVRNLLGTLRAPNAASGVPGLSGAYSSIELAAGIVEITAIARTGAETDASRINATRIAMAEAEASRIGVDQDAELASLIQIEQAYNANVQIIQTVSRMMQELTELR